MKTSESNSKVKLVTIHETTPPPMRGRNPNLYAALVAEGFTSEQIKQIEQMEKGEDHGCQPSQ